MASRKFAFEKRISRMGADPARLRLVGRGKRAYLWVGGEEELVGFLSGEKTLRRLAKAILAEVGDDE